MKTQWINPRHLTPEKVWLETKNIPQNRLRYYAPPPPVGFTGRRSHLGGTPGAHDHWWTFCSYRGACGAQGFASFGRGCCFCLWKGWNRLDFRKWRGHEHANYFVTSSHCGKKGNHFLHVWPLSALALLFFTINPKRSKYGTCSHLQLR